jgi:ATP-binding cassette subfamily B protein
MKPALDPESTSKRVDMKKIRLIIRFGRALVRLSPGKVTLYVLLTFISQTAIPLTLPLLLARVTNLSQRAQPASGSAKTPGSPNPETGAKGADANQPGGRAPTQPAAATGIVSSYLFWLLLTAALVPLGLYSRLAQADMDNGMEKHLRQGLFDKVIRQTPEFFRRYNPGELSNVLTQTSVEAKNALRSLTVDPLLQLLSLSIATGLIVFELGKMNSDLTWPIVVPMVVLGVVSVSLVQLKGNKPVTKVHKEGQDEGFSLAGLADSAVRSPEEIQVMEAEPLFSRRYQAGLDRLMRLKHGQVRTQELVNAAIGLPTQVILALLYGYIVFEVAFRHGRMEPGIFIALAGIAPQLMMPFRAFAGLGIIASSSWPGVELVTRLLEEDNRIKDLPGARTVDKLAPTLEVRNVDFRYGPNLEKVFEGLTFTAPTARITSLVGRMGQGKTTFFRLALRFFEPDSGQILLGGVPASSLALESLRRHAMIMSQFPAFFHDTVRDNFRVAKPEATDEEIRTLCEETQLWPILEKALGPSPLDCAFAAGMGLSGGEKRLFALTRCLLRDPTFLFLDEPTTNMSNDEKYSLIPMMRAACAGRTVVVVDHDIPWLIRFCDYFVVLDNKRIVQQGTAQQLLAEPGVLKDLYTLAFPQGPLRGTDVDGQRQLAVQIGNGVMEHVIGSAF